MFKEYFGIRWEFDRNEVDNIIEKHISEKRPGYVVSLDGNNFAIAMQNPEHLKRLNNSIVNNCDSHWVPWMINKIYGTEYKNYIGADLFIEYINKRKFKQFFFVFNSKVLDGLKHELSKRDPNILNMRFEELPFRKVEDFDYEGIAKMINDNEPDIIWISLGCPKQEMFMERLLPLLKQGVMFGFGAIFNFYSGLGDAPKRAPKWMLALGLEFLYRIYSEPQKQWRRCVNILKVFPKAYMSEKKRKKFTDKTNKE